MSKVPVTEGLLVTRNLDVDESADLQYAGKCLLFHLTLRNDTAATKEYFKLYDTAIAAVVGTDTPKMTIPLSAGESFNMEVTKGILMNNGISFGASTGIADNDTGAPAASAVQATAMYKTQP